MDSAGCNIYSARYKTGDMSSIIFSDIGSTKMNCHGEDVMIRESLFLKSLAKTYRYSLSGESMKFYDEKGDAVLEFSRIS
ncbi:MAG: META domain-containing protein [Methanomicrobium sp.]|nr:META domain-containing protein [Methanomicrobium sp.]MDD4299732.1 META domain-containing protein [Methanomicrobium sp.]